MVDVHFQVTSNVLYAAAGVYAVIRGQDPILAGLIFAVTIASITYHVHIGDYSTRMESHSYYIDVTVAIALFFYCVVRHYTVWAIAPAVAMLALLTRQPKTTEEYNRVHPWAHVCGGVALLACV